MLQHPLIDQLHTLRLRWAKLGQSACVEDLDTRTPRGIDRSLLAKLTGLSWITGPTGVGKSALFRALAKVDLIVLDDFALTPLSDVHRRDLLEILDDRYARKSTVITSQLPVEQWHAWLGDPTLADAILDRLVHNSYRLKLEGDSMRKRTARSVARYAPAAA